MVRIRERIGISPARQRQAAWLMEMGLLGMVFVGLERGSLGIVVNAGIGLAVTQLTPLLERDHEIPMDPALTLWITAAVFLHALGTVGIPGTSLQSFYRSVPWWDHLTHMLSSSVVAGAGYATVRAIDSHSERVHLPPKFIFVFILLFVIAFGVLWEVIEFGVSGAAELLGTATVLTQYGLSDTMLDLVFDTIGGIVVAIWGTAYLTDVSEAIRERFETTG